MESPAPRNEPRVEDTEQAFKKRQETVDSFTSSIYSKCRALPTSELLQYVDQLKGKVVLVTGAGSGIGSAFCTLAASLGAVLVLVDRNEKAIRELQLEIMDSNVAGEAHALDSISVTDWAALTNAFEWTMKKFGRVDSVICSAGVTEFGNPSFLAETFDSDGKLKAPNLLTLNVNLIGTIYSTKLALHYLKKSRTKGSLVLFGSLSSFFGIPLAPMYTSSKHAIHGLTRSLHYTAQPDGITVNMIAPWFTKTPILAAPTRLILAGLPYAKMQDVVCATIFAATNKQLSGAALPVDPKGVFLYPHESHHFGEEGFDTIFAKRTMVVVSMLSTTRDVVETLVNALPAGFGLIMLAIGLGVYAWMAVRGG